MRFLAHSVIIIIIIKTFSIALNPSKKNVLKRFGYNLLILVFKLKKRMFLVLI